MVEPWLHFQEVGMAIAGDARSRFSLVTLLCYDGTLLSVVFSVPNNVPNASNVKLQIKFDRSDAQILVVDVMDGYQTIEPHLARRPFKIMGSE